MLGVQALRGPGVAMLVCTGIMLLGIMLILNSRERTESGGLSPRVTGCE